MEFFFVSGTSGFLKVLKGISEALLLPGNSQSEQSCGFRRGQLTRTAILLLNVKRGGVYGLSPSKKANGPLSNVQETSPSISNENGRSLGM